MYHPWLYDCWMKRCLDSLNLSNRGKSLWMYCLDSVSIQWLRVIFLSTLQVLIICVTLNAVLQITTSLCGKICKTTAMTIVMAILKPFIQFDLPVHSTKTVLFNTGITLVHSCSDWCTAVDQVTHLLMILCHLNRSYTQPHQLVLNLKSMCQLWLCACALSLWLQLISSANSVFVTSHSECSVWILFFSWICQLTLSQCCSTLVLPGCIDTPLTVALLCAKPPYMMLIQCHLHTSYTTPLLNSHTIAVCQFCPLSSKQYDSLSLTNPNPKDDFRP